VAEPDQPEQNQTSDRILTVPNIISFARLLGVPVFLWLVLQPVFHGPKYDWWALGILAASGFTDWLDGKIARRWNQTSRLGALLDPLADRLYIISTLVGLCARHIMPWWLLGVLVGRDLILSVTIPVLSRYRYGPLPVSFVGKAGTFNLMYAFPLLLLADSSGALGSVARVIGWAFAGWGTGLYLLAGWLYLSQCYEVVSAARAEPHTLPVPD
jgi:cardiolipin synthase